jgi:hypothetical protein
VKPHSRASKHNIATVNPTRLGHDSLLVMIRAPGTTAAKASEIVYSKIGRIYKNVFAFALFAKVPIYIT